VPFRPEACLPPGGLFRSGIVIDRSDCLRAAENPQACLPQVGTKTVPELQGAGRHILLKRNAFDAHAVSYGLHPELESASMQGLIGAMRMYLWKHATILLASVLLFQLAALHSDAQDKPKRPRITGIDHVRLYVSDPDKSYEFYAKLMGVRKGGPVCLDDARPCLAVGLAQNQTIQLEKVPTSGVANWVAQIAFSTDNINELHRYLLWRGIKATAITNDKNPNRRQPYAAHFDVIDPEGNQISFVQQMLYVIEDPGPKRLPNSSSYLHTHLIHAGFVVKDMAAENKFYLDLLGFKLYWYGGFKDDGVDWYELQVPDGDNWIEYMLNTPADAAHKELGVQNHFSLGVKDIHAAADQLRKNGLLKFDGPEIGRDGKWGLDAYDPDGTRVEVMEFTPAGKPCCHPYTAPHPTP
jgi:catechol 2,3-dioxygenase-like lactoylglutathione lyase family enzyme